MSLITDFMPYFWENLAWGLKIFLVIIIFIGCMIALLSPSILIANRINRKIKKKVALIIVVSLINFIIVGLLFEILILRSSDAIYEVAGGNIGFLMVGVPIMVYVLVRNIKRVNS